MRGQGRQKKLAPVTGPSGRRLGIVVGLLLGGAILGAVGYYFAEPYREARRHWTQALQLLDDYDLEGARPHLQACLQYWPDSAEVHFVTAQAARRWGDFPTAYQQLQEAERLQWPTQDIALELVLIEVQQTGLTDANAHTLGGYFASRGPKEVLILDALASASLRTQQLAEVRKLDYWMENYPDDWLPWYRRGEFYFRVGQPALARNDLAEATRRRPAHAGARRLLIAAQMATGQHAEALDQLAVHLRNQPDNAEGLVWLARCQRQLNQLEAARGTLNKLLAKHPQDPSGLLTLALLEADLENDEAAHRGLQQIKPGALTEANDILAAAILAAGVSWRLGRTQEAEAHERRLEQLKADVAAAEKALEEFQQGATGVAQRYQLADIYLRIGAVPVAVNWLQSIVVEHPEEQRACQLLAEIYAKRDDPTSRRLAEILRQRAAELGRKDSR